MSFDVCVIGAGVIGLSTALNIQRLIRLVNVTVIADAFGQDTRTPVLENLFIPAPFSVKDDVSTETAFNWFKDASEHHFELTKDPDSASTNGNTLKVGTTLWWHDGHHVLPQCVRDYRLLSRDEMDDKEYNVAYGAEFTTVHIDLPSYLRWLLKEIRSNGGVMKYDTVFSLQELYGQYDVVVNCAGLRTREMKADADLHYIRCAMLQTPGIGTDNFLFTQDDVYVCPHPNIGRWDIGFYKTMDDPCMDVDEDCQWHIVHRAHQYFPDIKEREVVKTWAEKRPYRMPILLEIEYLNCSGPILPVVHNVGHGDRSISLAWGRGIDAAHLVQEVQRAVKPCAKKWYPFGKI